MLFLLALTFGLDDDAVTALERMVGLVEDVGEAHGVEHPIQMTVAATDGVRIIAARYSSEGESRSLYFSTDARALKQRYADDDRIQQLSDEARAVVSEPLGDVEGVWNAVPESSIGIVQPGQDELRSFTPRRGAAAPGDRGIRLGRDRRLLLLIGGLLVMWRPIPQRALGLVMAFGAGVLISAVAFELAAEAVQRVGSSDGGRWPSEAGSRSAP